jgi:hypothetical protein
MCRLGGGRTDDPPAHRAAAPTLHPWLRCKVGRRRLHPEPLAPTTACPYDVLAVSAGLFDAAGDRWPAPLAVHALEPDRRTALPMDGGGAPAWLHQPGAGAAASLQSQFPDIDADVGRSNSRGRFRLALSFSLALERAPPWLTAPLLLMRVRTRVHCCADHQLCAGGKIGERARDHIGAHRDDPRRRGLAVRASSCRRRCCPGRCVARRHSARPPPLAPQPTRRGHLRRR